MEWFTWLTTYTLIILAELGDKTQIATLLLASNNPSKRWLVFGAGALALSCCVLIEVTLGATIARILSVQTINRITGYVFLFIGLATIFREYVIWRKWKLSFGLFPKSSPKRSEIT